MAGGRAWAHGATYHVAPAVFRELGANVKVIGAEPDGFNINEGVGSTATELLSQQVVETQADFGIAFDGDGDRVLFVAYQTDIGRDIAGQRSAICSCM